MNCSEVPQIISELANPVIKNLRLLSLVLLLLLTACVSVEPQTTIKRGAGWYTVKPTDTLYSIAWRYGLDYQQLAQWNNIAVNTPIHPGQRLRLIAGRKTVTARPATNAEINSATEDQQSVDKPVSSAAAISSNIGSEFADPEKWLWPTRGKVLNTFSAKVLSRRGIDIAGKDGQAILAVAKGRVVYSGNGLAGYGNLIIIKHSDTYLSAYAYCRNRLVNEGTVVEGGQEIASMGQWDKTAKLHFEIRKNGKPVDPIKYLPQ